MDPRPHTDQDHRPPAVVESEVMGRAAVAVVVALMQPVAIAQLGGWAQGSNSLDELGVAHLSTAWAVVMILGGIAMLLSYALPRPDDTRVLEMAACGMVALVSAAHLAAVLTAVGWSGSAWVSGLDASLIINCGGRAVFLGRQIWWVKRQAGAPTT